MSHPQPQQQQQQTPVPPPRTWSPAPHRPQLRPILAMGTSYLHADINDRHHQKQQELQAKQASAARRWTREQLKASDAIIRVQSGSNQLASQRGMTPFGGPRDVVQGVAGLHKLEDEYQIYNRELQMNEAQFQAYHQRQSSPGHNH